MNFNSVEYLIFLPVVLLLFRVLPRGLRRYWLLTASLFFYMSWNPRYLLLILLTSVTAYVCGVVTEKAKRPGVRKLCFAVTLAVCLGLLVFFKYFDFLLGGISDLAGLFGLNVPQVSLGLLLPVGISFYTFQTLSYVIDVYRGTVPAEHSFMTFLLYVCFFPQLVAGPIERPGDLLPQLKANRDPDRADIREGIAWLISGFFRKCVIADMVGIMVDRVYGTLGTAHAPAVLAASFLFLLQMYNDFAGYSEIAMGSARLLGVKLTQNFNQPLRSRSYTEFFRRWHITLNRWFTDYVYIPLGGSRCSTLKRFRNTMIVFLLCGLWHGANMTYVLWGLAAGGMICMETLLRKKSAKADQPTKRSVCSAVLQRTGILLLFTLSAVLFRAATVADIRTAMCQIFLGGGWSFSGLAASAHELGLSLERACFLIPALGVMLVLHRLTAGAVCRNHTYAILMRTAIYLFAVLAIAFCWLELLSASDVTSFQYFQF